MKWFFFLLIFCFVVIGQAQTQDIVVLEPVDRVNKKEQEQVQGQGHKPENKLVTENIENNFEKEEDLNSSLILLNQTQSQMSEALLNAWMNVQTFMEATPDNIRTSGGTLQTPWLKLVGEGAEFSGLNQWLLRRVSLFLPNSMQIQSGSDFTFGKTENVFMLNITSLAWFRQNAYDSHPILQINGKSLTLNSPSSGLFMLGRAFNPKDDPFLIAKILVHESRHSDCEVSPASDDFRKFTDPEQINEIKTCGYFHSRCPDDHDLSGLFACDENVVGAYATEAFFLDYLLKLCQQNPQCGFKRKAILRGLFIESKGRVLGWDQLLQQKMMPSQIYLNSMESNSSMALNQNDQLRSQILNTEDPSATWSVGSVRIPEGLSLLPNTEAFVGDTDSTTTQKIQTIFQSELNDLLYGVVFSDLKKNYPLMFKSNRPQMSGLKDEISKVVLAQRALMRKLLIQLVPDLNNWWDYRYFQSKELLHTQIAVKTQIGLSQIYEWLHNAQNFNTSNLLNTFERRIQSWPLPEASKNLLLRTLAKIPLQTLQEKIFKSLMNACVAEVKMVDDENSPVLPQVIGDLCQSWN